MTETNLKPGDRVSFLAFERGLDDQGRTVVYHRRKRVTGSVEGIDGATLVVRVDPGQGRDHADLLRVVPRRDGVKSI